MTVISISSSSEVTKRKLTATLSTSSYQSLPSAVSEFFFLSLHVKHHLLNTVVCPEATELFLIPTTNLPVLRLIHHWKRCCSSRTSTCRKQLNLHPPVSDAPQSLYGHIKHGGRCRPRLLQPIKIEIRSKRPGAVKHGGGKFECLPRRRQYITDRWTNHQRPQRSHSAVNDPSYELVKGKGKCSTKRVTSCIYESRCDFTPMLL